MPPASPGPDPRPPAGLPPRPPVSFPVVRRGGYDKSAVDSRVQQLASEKAGLSSSLTESEKRVLELEAQLEETRTELPENLNPSYAGLGGRA